VLLIGNSSFLAIGCFLSVFLFFFLAPSYSFPVYACNAGHICQDANTKVIVCLDKSVSVVIASFFSDVVPFLMKKMGRSEKHHDNYLALVLSMTA